MLKRIFTFILIILLLTALGGYFLSRYHNQLRQQRQTAKAPDTSITLIEGWTNDQTASYLEQKGLISAAAFLLAQKKFDVSAYPMLSSKPTTANLEGFLFPDTYRIAAYPDNPQATADGVIKKTLDNFSVKFTPDMGAAAKARGYSVYQIVTLASIIEKETGRSATTAEQKQALDDERKTIAGIFYNRLSAGMPLESDATVNFVTGKSDAQVINQDTEIDSPYNTYKYKGLPPGPICNPSLSSLLAAVYPEATNYFYFLHDQTTGQAVYAVTYEQHLLNKQKYLH